jgi:fatty acid desaturase
MRALATLLHEASHHALSRNRKANWLMGTVLSGWTILQLLGRYTRSHVWEHHKHLADPERDPDTRQYVSQGLLDANPARLLRDNLLAAFSGAKTLINLPYLLRDRLLPEPGTRLTPAERAEIAGFLAAWTILILVLALNGWLLAFVLVWVAPYLTVFQATNWAIETSEHFPLPWTRSDRFQLTRNRKGGPIERFFFGCHGESWHRVHHERPGIPFFNAAKAHAVMMRDAAYAAFEAETGGLFSRGPNGAPSIIAAIKADLRRLKLSKKKED